MSAGGRIPPLVHGQVHGGQGGWYLWSGPGSYLVSLSASPAEAGAVVAGLSAGEQREGFATC